MMRMIASSVLLLAACSDAPTPPPPAPASTQQPGANASGASTNAGTSDIALGGSASSEEGAGSTAPDANSTGATGGAKMRRDPNAAAPSTVSEPDPAPAPAATGVELTGSAPTQGPAAASGDGGSAVTGDDPATAALRARAREPRWNDFRAIVQKQADLMVKSGLARKKSRQDPTPENRAAYDALWGGIAPLAQKVTEYMAQPRFSEEDRAVMSMIVDEIQSKAMAEVEKAP